MGNYLVIGGSSGIGKATVNDLQTSGHKVWASYNSNVQTSTASCSYFHLDVLNGELDLGILPDVLDGLVYCPGSINLKPFHRLKPESFVEDYRLQVEGAIKVIQKVLPNLKASDQASVVLFSAVAVQSGFNFHSQVSASKGAIEGLTKALAAEFAPKIRVNAIAPSLTQTNLSQKLLNNEQKVEGHGERHPLKRIGQAEDIASGVTFLLSPKSNWMTGQILHIDGGMSTIKS